MPRSANQKTKLLHLLQIFFYDSDEDHPLTVPTLVEKLEEKGISAERKSIYNDIETLQQMDFDIQLRRGKGYFLGERIFQLAELKLLVDAVQSSKFIPARKSSQ
ncbi:MAG: HTH domain-containing protein, partial [Candidatus Onthomonas sp.]|nr:HTH domain-containing protein [Candidatus Onthomonas sp.]